MPRLSDAELRERDDLVEDFLHELDGWERAYPLSMFPEPDLKRAAELLRAGGMTLDAVSASNMRHVVSCIAPKARAAIERLSMPEVTGEMIEAGIDAWRTIVEAMEAREASATPEDLPDYDEGDVARAIYLAMTEARRK